MIVISYLPPAADLKVELRQTAFDMWMACYPQQEIAEAIGYSEKVVHEFFDLLRNRGNGIDAENPVWSENPALTAKPDREFDDPRAPAWQHDRIFLLLCNN